MLIYIQQLDRQADFAVDVMSIKVSVALAVAHVLLEYVQLNYEAKACKTSMAHYCITCYNGRFGWVPYADSLASIADQIEHVPKD